ncbi:hypothetical protein ASZ90_011048 [hydrocarbon metagenome]|uniref:Uncharacterized protein n=1 Tax=hydrocarbon metagenome TaxID=938273 RepID=A0A0W8FED6_9ZZZZ
MFSSGRRQDTPPGSAEWLTGSSGRDRRRVILCTGISREIIAER